MRLRRTIRFSDSAYVDQLERDLAAEKNRADDAERRVALLHRSIDFVAGVAPRKEEGVSNQ